MSTEAIINYIFRDKFDSPLLEKESISKKLEQEKEETLESDYYNPKNINKIVYQIENKLLGFNTLYSRKKRESIETKNRIEQLAGEFSVRLLEAKQLLNSALLSERRLTGETFTSLPPLSKEYATSATTATIKDSIVMGIKNSEIKGEEFVLISSLNIRGDESTYLRIYSKDFPYVMTIENKIKPYSQLRIEVPAVIRAGVFNIKFEQVQIISVLNSEGYEIIPRQASKELSIPVTSETKSIRVRFHNNSRQDIKLLSASYTDKIYLDEVIYETKKLNINEVFSHVSVDSCDNYTDPNVDIKYYISVNSEKYIEFRPVNKFKVSLHDSSTPSVINTDMYTNNEVVKLENYIFEDNVYKFIVEDLKLVTNKLKALEKKFGVDLYSMKQYFKPKEDSYSFTSYAIKDFTLVLNIGQNIRVNGTDYIAKNSNLTISLSKGFNTIEVAKDMWKEPINLLVNYIKEIKKGSLVIVNRETLEISEIPFIFNTLQEQTNSVYLQLLQQEIDVYMREIELKKRITIGSFIEYFYKDNVEPIYLASYQRQRQVDTVQIKAIMKSKDKKTCPFISRLILRGV